MTIEMYGHTIDLTPIDEGNEGVVTDVLVVARAVRYNDDGKPEEALLVSATDTTTPILQQGMANDLMLAISLNRSYDVDASA